MIYAKFSKRTFLGAGSGVDYDVYHTSRTDTSCRYRMFHFPEFSLWANQPATETLVGSHHGHYDGLPPNFNFISKPSEVVPRSFDVDSYEYTDRSMTAKEFLSLKEKGYIVLKPMRKYEVKATLLPGAPKDAPFEVVPLNRVGTYTLDGTYIGPQCNYTNRLITSMSGIPCEEFYSAHETVNTTTKTHWHVADIDDLVLPDASIAFAVWRDLSNQITSREWDTGLITAVTAEANSGAMDVLTEIGEARETVSYLFGLLGSIIDLAITLRREIANVRRKPGKSMSAIADEIASLWMQFRYAVSPIGYSINDALDLMTSYYSPYQSFRQGVEWSTDPITINDYTFPSVKVVDRVFMKHQYTLETKTHNMKFNPLATAWELTPLSFVIDWALNIGDLLSALWVPSNVSQVAAQYSRQLRLNSNLIVGPGAAGDIVLTSRYYDVKPFDPLVQVGLTFDLNMTTKRWADALSLSWLATKGRLRD